MGNKTAKLGKWMKGSESPKMRRIATETNIIEKLAVRK
jgi:hypothetical protein